MTLFHMSWIVLYVVGMNQQESLRDKSGITSSEISSFVEKAVNVPLVIGDHLGGKATGDEKLLRNLARDVRGILEKGPDSLLEPSGEELSALIEDYASSPMAVNRP